MIINQQLTIVLFLLGFIQFVSCSNQYDDSEYKSTNDQMSDEEALITSVILISFFLGFCFCLFYAQHNSEVAREKSNALRSQLDIQRKQNPPNFNPILLSPNGIMPFYNNPHMPYPPPNYNNNQQPFTNPPGPGYPQQPNSAPVPPPNYQNPAGPQYPPNANYKY